MLSSTNPETTLAYRYGGAALLIAAAVIVTALGFQYVGGYPPCPLCLQQRYAYYAGIPLLFLAMAAASEMPRVAAFIFLAVALMFLANAGLAAYHAGVEWKIWPAPDTCATVQGLPTSAADLLAAAESARVVRCDEAPWRAAGLSLAGWNVVVSLLLSAAALRAAFAGSSER
jgi:disulfide bond formation protein DsbB